MDNSDILNGFSNPNYTLSKDDALNSNELPPTTQYYDSDGGLYETIGDAATTTTTMHSNETAPLHHNNGGGGDTSTTTRQCHSASQSMDSLSAATYDSGGPTYESVASPVESEGRFSMTSSCVTSPGCGDAVGAAGLVSVEHEDDTNPYSEIGGVDGAGGGGGGGGTGFKGFYATAHESRTPLLTDSTERVETEDRDKEDDVKQPLLKEKDRLQSSDPSQVVCSPGGDSNDSGIQADVPHVRGPVNDDIYAVVDKQKKTTKPKKEERNDDKEDILPPGWEKHEDEDGPYYWHIKSGTIQREPPPPATPSASSRPDDQPQPPKPTASKAKSKAKPESPSEDLLHEFEDHAFKYASHSLKSLKSSKQKEEAGGKSSSNFPIRFAVRSLGWVEIAEGDLTPERSSKAVNKCIVDLSLGRNDINDVVGRWGDGKDLFMDLDEQHLSLSDPTDMSLLNVQPIQSIRVWGVGRDNGRDFAYVARDRVTRKHMCHVFRCDTPARQIANTLRDICKKIMMEQSLQQGMQAMQSSMKNMAAPSASRPNNLPNLEKHNTATNGAKITYEDLIKNTSFPTPMEEPKKILKCHFLGTMEVAQPTGVDVLNNAMEKVYARVPPEKWMYVDVAVAPSTITITEHGKPDNILAESRVRFLSFMGIAQRNVKLCSYISHTAQDTFIAHVFHCEPSAGAVCKTIEAACKLRYQKCLDAHQKQMQSAKQQASQQTKGFGASLKSVFGHISRGKKAKS